MNQLSNTIEHGDAAAVVATSVSSFPYEQVRRLCAGLKALSVWYTNILFACIHRRNKPRASKNATINSSPLTAAKQQLITVTPATDIANSVE